MAKDNKIGAKTSKLTLGQFVWNGFNLTVAIGFLGSLSIFANSSSDGGYGLGWNVVWMFAFIGFIACVCAFAFSKLTKYYKQDNNGGSYIFARGAFGRFVGFVTAFLVYIILPLVLANQILMLIKANFDPIMSGGINPDGSYAWWCAWTKSLGNWSFLIFDLIGVLLSALFIGLTFLGLKTYKKMSRYVLLIKWVAVGVLISFALIAAFLPENKNNASNWADHSQFDLGSFVSMFCASFYYFTGFESFATSASIVKCPEKNIGRGVTIVMLMTTLFYVSMIVLFMCAEPKFHQNINTSFWTDSQLADKFKILLYLGPIIMLICNLAQRSNAITQITLYGGTSLQPIADEGYISEKFGGLDKNNFPINAMKLNVIISSIAILAWALIPDIVVGFAGSGANFININTIISAASVFYILLYILILLTILKLTLTGTIQNSFIESFFYILAIGVLAIVFIYHFYELFNNAIYPTDPNDQVKNIVALGVELLFFVGVIIFIFCVYFLYYKPKLTKRLRKNRSMQLQKDYEFRMLDGWTYFKRKVYLRTLSFFNKRTKLVNKNYEDFSNPYFKDKYRLMSEKYLKKTKKYLMQYLKYSERIEKYNKKHGFDVKKEIFDNNQSSVIFITQLQKKVNTTPRKNISWQIK